MGCSPARLMYTDRTVPVPITASPTVISQQPSAVADPRPPVGRAVAIAATSGWSATTARASGVSSKRQLACQRPLVGGLAVVIDQAGSMVDQHGQGADGRRAGQRIDQSGQWHRADEWIGTVHDRRDPESAECGVRRIGDGCFGHFITRRDTRPMIRRIRSEIYTATRPLNTSSRSRVSVELVKSHRPSTFS